MHGKLRHESGRASEVSQRVGKGAVRIDLLVVGRDSLFVFGQPAFPPMLAQRLLECTLKRGGQHVVLPEHTPLANLHLTILNKVGIEADSFADSTGIITEV